MMWKVNHEFTNEVIKRLAMGLMSTPHSGVIKLLEIALVIKHFQENLFSKPSAWNKIKTMIRLAEYDDYHRLSHGLRTQQ